MKIKVCGMRDAENIRGVMSLGIDFMGFIFWQGSPRYVKNIPIRAGIIPDKANADIKDNAVGESVKRVGVFVDEMPQTVITQVYNYHLDYIQLHGDESPVYIDNLKRTLIPDIAPDVKVIKALSIREADDVKRWREYKDTADMFLFDTKCASVGGSGRKFDWAVLDAYDGDIPFLLSGGIGPDDADEVRAFSHPQCIGIDLNSKFETAPAIKDIDKLKQFIEKIRKQ